MKRVLFYFLLTISMIEISSVSAQTLKMDTLYYDSNWKGVHMKELASYMRIIYYAPKEGNYSDVVKDFYITGELQSEGDFPVYIDRYNDSKSKWKGRMITYYKSGKKSSELNFTDHSLPDKIIEYYENGNFKMIANFVDGKIQNTEEYYENGNIKLRPEYRNEKLNGLLFEYFEDGRNMYVEAEMLDGRPKNNYITLVGENGNRTKYDRESQNVIAEIPQLENLQSTFISGNRILYYEMNGIFIGVNLSLSKELGKYYSVRILLANNTLKSFIFNAEQTTAVLYKNNKEYDCHVLSSDEYAKIVGRKIKTKSFWNALGEGLAAANAGYSSASTTSSSTGYKNSASIINSTGVIADNKGSVVAGAGSTIGVGSSNYGTSSIYGSTSTTQTAIHDGAVQYMANQNAKRNIAAYDNELERYKQTLDEGYLKSNVVESGQSISGYINIKYEKGDNFVLLIPINNVVYEFPWAVNSKNPTVYSKGQTVSNQGASKKKKSETDFWDPIY